MSFDGLGFRWKVLIFHFRIWSWARTPKKGGKKKEINYRLATRRFFFFYLGFPCKTTHMFTPPCKPGVFRLTQLWQLQANSISGVNAWPGGIYLIHNGYSWVIVRAAVLFMLYLKVHWNYLDPDPSKDRSTTQARFMWPSPGEWSASSALKKRSFHLQQSFSVRVQRPCLEPAQGIYSANHFPSTGINI